MDSVAEEGPLPEDHAERAGFGRDAHVAGVPADVEHRDVAGSGRGRVDDAAGTGAYAVGPYQEVSSGLRPVLEPRRNTAVGRDPGVHEPLAVLDAGAAPDCLVAQRLVEV
jgi:hypothetical protein